MIIVPLTLHGDASARECSINCVSARALLAQRSDMTDADVQIYFVPGNSSEDECFAVHVLLYVCLSYHFFPIRKSNYNTLGEASF